MTGIKNLDIWQAEARFASRFIQPELENSGAKIVLEVGSGVGIMLANMADRFPDKKFTGLEPFGQGFSKMSPLNSNKKRANTTELKLGYEDYVPDEKLDFVYAINVFEHLPDWQDFLIFLKTHLAENGQAILLCPNYSFPYESHYNLPIIFNKSVTKALFSDVIIRFDVKHNTDGLWDSLNFVKARHVHQYALKLNLDISIDTSPSFYFLERLETDTEFAKRQWFIGKIAKFASRIGLLKIFSHSAFWRFHPYMMIKLTNL